VLGWCVAKLKSVKGGFAVIDYSVGGGPVKTDIIPLERVRPVNKKYAQQLPLMGLFIFILSVYLAFFTVE
jgi:hypothetical protein